MGKKEDDNSSVEKRSIESMDVESKKKKEGFPLQVGFILGNEFCERYSYYGMRTVLVLYLSSDLIGWDENTATAVYHAFTVLAYLFPLLGAIIADSSWGKYWTIFWLSIVYAIGSGINMMSAIKPIGGDNLAVHAALASVGLFVIAFGTGGIKPCVSAFGGDQFSDDQDDYRKSFFSLFYFAINAGSLVSTFVSPLIRSEVSCFGDECYALAFGIPTALMVVAILLFAIGTPYYKRVEPEGNIFLEVSRVIGYALKVRGKVPSKERNKEHWLDYAEDGTRERSQIIRDIKYVLKVLVIYIPLPLFWSLFDQQGSRWTLQAVRMNGVIGDVLILPDQIQLCNPLMIIALIPLFEVTLYRWLRAKNINFSPLKRMGLGMWLAGLAFVVAAIIQNMINENLTLTPRKGETTLRVLNGVDLDCNLTMGGSIYNWNTEEPMVMFMQASDTLEDMINEGKYTIEASCPDYTTFEAEIDLLGEKAYDAIMYKDGTNIAGKVVERNVKKSQSGNAIFSVANAYNENIEVSMVIKGKNDKKMDLMPGMKYEFEELKQTDGPFTLNVKAGSEEYTDEINPFTGADYTYLVAPGKNNYNFKDIYENDVNIFWMVPQYFIITLGEVFLSVTGLEFAYSQAPQSMKAVLQSFWLLTVSIGNIIVLIVAELSLIPNQADEYYLFAGLIAFAALIFLWLAIRYEYVDESEFRRDDSDSDDDVSSVTSSNMSEKPMKKKEKKAYDNQAFVKNTQL